MFSNFLFKKYEKYKTCYIYYMYLSITCYFIQHTRLTINSLCLFQFEQFQKDFIAPYTVTGYRVNILSGDKNLPQDAHVARMNNLLDVDGEMIDLVDGEYEVWYVFKACC